MRSVLSTFLPDEEKPCFRCGRLILSTCTRWYTRDSSGRTIHGDLHLPYPHPCEDAKRLGEVHSVEVQP